MVRSGDAVALFREWGLGEDQSRRRSSKQAVTVDCVQPMAAPQENRSSWALVGPAHELRPSRVPGDLLKDGGCDDRVGQRPVWAQSVAVDARAGHTRLPMGKHRGERFDAVPEHYPRWIVEG